MKNFIYFLLSFLLILQTPFYAFAEQNVTSVNSADFNMLKKLGVFDGFEINESDEKVTRGKFAASVYNLFQYEGYNTKNEDQFIDVGNLHYAFNAINTLYELGFVSGVSSEFFAPESEITVNEAVKILVSALGYSDYAKVKGGYPTGYILTAKKLDILSANYAAGSLSASTLAELLANTLNVCPLTEESISNTEIIYNDGDGESLGKLSFNLYEAEGFVSGIDPAALFEIENGENDIITIDKTEYFAEGIDVFSFVGKYVDFWYVKADNEKVGKVISMAVSSSADVITIESKNISAFNNNEYLYYGNGKSNTAKIDSASEIFYNGKSVPYFKELMMPSNGSVTLVDYKGSSAYDSIIISSYINACINSVDAANNSVLFENGVSYPKISGATLNPENVLMLNGSDSNFYLRIYDKKLEEKKISSMSNGQVASVYFDPYGQGAVIYYNGASVSGVIESVYSNGEKVSINGKNYNVLFDNISKTDIFAGTGGKYLLDYLGNIAYIDTKEGGLKSAFFIRAKYTDGLSGKAYVELVDISQKIPIQLEMKSVIKFGDSIYGNSKYTINNDADLQTLAGRLRKEVETGTANKHTSLGFIRYKTNSKGQIIEIHTVTSPEYPVERHLNGVNDKLSGLQTNTTLNTIGDKVLYNDAITVFADIPYVTSTGDPSYLDTASSAIKFMNDSMIGSNSTLDKLYDIYYLDDSDIASVIIKYGDELKAPIINSGDAYMTKGFFDNLGMFIGKGEGVDENGESRETVRFVDVKGVEHKYFVSSKYSTSSNIDYSLFQENLEAGDVFAYYVQNERIGNFLKVYDADMGEPMSAFLGAPNAYIYMKEGSSKFQSISGATSGKYNTTYKISVGRIYDVNTYVLKVALGDTTDNSNLAYFNINPDSIVVCDSKISKREEIRKGTLADLKGIVHYGADNASKVAVYIKSGRDITVFVYN